MHRLQYSADKENLTQPQQQLRSKPPQDNQYSNSNNQYSSVLGPSNHSLRLRLEDAMQEMEGKR
jgi:hypothetical protein